MAPNSLSMHEAMTTFGPMLVTPQRRRMPEVDTVCPSKPLSRVAAPDVLTCGYLVIIGLPKPPQPHRQPVPNHPSCPCPAAQGGARWRGAPRARPGGVLVRVGGARGAGRRQARAPAGAEWHGVGGRGQWKRPFDFPILRVSSVPILNHGQAQSLRAVSL